MLDAGALRLVLDTRDERNVHDDRTIRRILGDLSKRPKETGLTYEHLDSAHEQLLWLADVIGWCYGAGGDWRRRITPAVSAVIDLA
ncbi:MAG: hypothetical protein LC799_22240 [Actinobacteria bacterium]|nr:hypothetical protein [Actinomycetota bacterium]